MPAQRRSDVFDPHTVGVYHCWNRLVRRRHLFGQDSVTGRDFSYRKFWVRDRFKYLSGYMAIDVLDYAILGNHLHVVLRNRPDIVQSWSDEEVARRWWYVCPTRKNKDGTVPPPKPCEIKLLLNDVDEYRSRLSNISWMMRLVCQPIARRANKEDDVEGRFFAQRFDCRRLKNLADILTCSIYVDLNAIRAGIAATPETSEFTSAFDRIRALWQRTQQELDASFSLPAEEEADAWLAPVFLDECSDAYAATNLAAETGTGTTPQSASNPIQAPRVSNKGFLPVTLNQYLTLLDIFGRLVRGEKLGAIPQGLTPILERLNLRRRDWLDTILGLADEFPTIRPYAAACT